MDYYHDFWTGFLAAQIVNRSLEISLAKCPGCESKLKSPLLHLHHQLSLLDKIQSHFNEIKGSMLSSLGQLYDQFQDKLPHSEDLQKDKDIYVNNARMFLISVTPDAIYFGRYLTEMNDIYIHEGMIIKKKKLVNLKKTSAKRQKKNEGSIIN